MLTSESCTNNEPKKVDETMPQLLLFSRVLTLTFEFSFFSFHLDNITMLITIVFSVSSPSLQLKTS